jgi:hypothetical protein
MNDINPDNPDNPDDYTSNEASVGIDARLLRPDVSRILSYLGELKAREYAPVMQIAADLSISYGSCAEHIRYLNEQEVVVVRKTPSKSMVRLNNDMNPAFFSRIVCEWQPEFGTHPSAGRRTVTAANLRTN